MALLVGLAGALGSGVAGALVGGGASKIITAAIVGFFGGLSGWFFYIKPRIGNP
jgi:hypothetical protein